MNKGPIKVGSPDVDVELPSHVSGIREGNGTGGYEKMKGHLADGRSTAERSTGVGANKRNPIDPRMPNLSPA